MVFTFEGRAQLGQLHWENYRAELSELIHAACGESTQEYNLVTEFEGRPAILRGAVDQEEIFLDAYPLTPAPDGGFQIAHWDSEFLTCDRS